jgi:hypothetical protein
MCERRAARSETLDVSPTKPNPVRLPSAVCRLASLGLFVIACAGSPADTTAAPPTTTVPTTTTVEGTWVWGIDSVDLGEGYTLGPCEGDADQVACITKDGAVVGSAEHLSLPVESFDFLDGVDSPVESVELIAFDYVATFSEDRQSTCPHLEFREVAPTAVTIGGRPGLRYGFEELDAGLVVERNLIYGVRVEPTLHLYSFAAIAAGACLSNEGELTDPALLDRLESGIDQIMAGVESG